MPRSAPPPPGVSLQALAAERWRYAVTLTAATIVVYFGFILLIAYDRQLLGRLVAPGLSIGIVLGALVIVVSWLLTWVYVRWANARYDVELDRLQRSGAGADAAANRDRWLDDGGRP